MTIIIGGAATPTNNVGTKNFPEVHAPPRNPLPSKLNSANNDGVSAEEACPLINAASTHSTLNKNRIDLFKGVMTNDLKKMKSLIKDGADVNTKGPKGLTAIVHVLFGNFEGEPNFDIALELFQAKDLKIDKSTTGPFLPTLQSLKKYQDDKYCVDKFEHLKMTEPALGKMDIVAKDADVTIEMQYTKSEMKKWQEASGNVINPPELTHTQKNWFEAIQNSDIEAIIEAINRMIQFGPDVNMTDHLGRTALWFAAYKGDVDVLEILLGRDDLIINKDTAGEFHTELSLLRHCLFSKRIEKSDIREALQKLTTKPYPKVADLLLQKVDEVARNDVSLLRGLARTFIGAFCANPFGMTRAYVVN